ncbi:hypothetical protein DM02DRAFT_663870 [Periconia macrospinosa]|uniref:Uncharacterized protein n=1 Tax=Periconia macrospinosa TaxID=97972 RepID=A0A2V1D0K3_9PLEO|nr:hypothetical protein DM02DRAFT_663870 [Periconia macrospinosa]
MRQIIESRYLRRDLLENLCRKKWGEKGWKFNWVSSQEAWVFDVPEELTEEELNQCKGD